MTAYLPYPDWLSAVISPVVPVRWYTLLHLLAYLLVFILFLRHLRRNDGTEEIPSAQRFFFWFILGYLFAGRIVAVVLFTPLDALLARPWMVIWPFDGDMEYQGLRGMSFGGGLIGGGLALLLYRLRYRIRVLLWADALVIGVPLMFVLVRLGNFANQELYGRVTSLPWGIVFPEALPVRLTGEGMYRRAVALGVEVIGNSGYANMPRHPAQIYEALVTGLAAWGALQIWVIRRRLFPGIAASIYLIIYGAAQFLFGYIRIPPLREPFVLRISSPDKPVAVFTSFLDLTADQLLSLLIAAIGVGALLLVRRYRARRPGVETYHPG